jgi:hypothetical protein
LAKWDWLTKAGEKHTWGFILRVIAKAALLFVVLNLLFVMLKPLPALGKISIYNWLVDGRARLPYGENAAQSYNLSLNNLNAMFASHEISRDKAVDEFRVVLVGDSSTWGFLLKPDDTLAGQINRGGYRTLDGRRVVAYNIGYPTMSLLKDLLLLDKALEYEPDMIVWLVTLESFPRDEQLDSPPAANNPDRVRELIDQYDLDIDPDDSRFAEYDFWDNTIYGQRRALADLINLQRYGVMWATTGIDQHYPATYTLRTSDFQADESWHELEGPDDFNAAYLTFDILQAGVQRLGDVPLLLVNEPIFISDGVNSDLRYNLWYPRWLYDEYRALMAAQAEAGSWNYVDVWDAVAPHEFTDSPVHMTPAGTGVLSDRVREWIRDLSDGVFENPPVPVRRWG